MPEPSSDPAYLFVYGTLRAAFDGPMATGLRRSAQLIGPAVIGGTLYRVADYPGLVPGGVGLVHGDLFALRDATATLAVLDDYEECAPHHPLPHEYRRERCMVRAASGPVEAWTYVYAYDVSGLPVVAGGDFLACVGEAGG
ncbi:gamma-glutamylcyclotransferase family protein [Sphingobium sp. CR2-8]|uniref:gamma-glutamylcyclotransferase family protein n=1 Tax=Sphingobium sp. CR2-8 TaxID=1306534 RepID=UPI002DC02F82|nr:gamma-glutamylcyclotransferase family protein [Sphingobium sp. CR2-8]MEC3909910.1 gamma-glutamylcyclotransferase family protein [Sphingobium sp. CR2-8]